jgi:hypothetical protein
MYIFGKYESFLDNERNVLNAPKLVNVACISKKKSVFTLALLPDVAEGALNRLQFLLFLKHPFKLHTATLSFRSCGEYSHNYWSREVRVEAEREREREREMHLPLQENDSYIPFTCMTQTVNGRYGQSELEDAQRTFERKNYC